MIFIALGANLPGRFGPPAATIEAAKGRLQEKGVRIVRSSGVWISAPVPVSDQPWYHNAVCAVETDIPPQDLLGLLQAIEEEFGRVRIVRNEARVLDLDIVAYNDEKIDNPRLIIPHPRMHERAFVLYPLQQIAPGWRHPVTGKSVQTLIAGLPEGQDIRAA